MVVIPAAILTYLVLTPVTHQRREDRFFLCRLLHCLTTDAIHQGPIGSLNWYRFRPQVGNTASAVRISVLNLVCRNPQPQAYTEPSLQPRQGIMMIAQAS